MLSIFLALNFLLACLSFMTAAPVDANSTVTPDPSEAAVSHFIDYLLSYNGSSSDLDWSQFDDDEIFGPLITDDDNDEEATTDSSKKAHNCGLFTYGTESECPGGGSTFTHGAHFRGYNGKHHFRDVNTFADWGIGGKKVGYKRGVLHVGPIGYPLTVNANCRAAWPTKKHWHNGKKNHKENGGFCPQQINTCHFTFKCSPK